MILKKYDFIQVIHIDVAGKLSTASYIIEQCANVITWTSPYSLQNWPKLLVGIWLPAKILRGQMKKLGAEAQNTIYM